MTTFRAALAASASVLALGAAPAATAADPAPSGHTRVVADCQHYRVEPRRVVAACADSGEYALVRHYDHWRARSATGSGVLVVNDCRPSCAEGTFRRYPAIFRFERVRRGDGGPVFTRLAVDYVRGGHHRTTSLRLPTEPF